MKGLFKFLLFIFLLSCPVCLFAQMSDDQVIEFAKQQNSAGKSQQEIAQALLARGVTQQQVQRIRQKMQSQVAPQGSSSANDVDRTRVFNGEIIPDSLPYQEKNKIFGHDIFRSKTLSFEPNMNIATPATYVLGPGDELIIDISGVSQVSSKMKVAPDGSVVVPKIGSLSVSGMTVEQAQAKVRSIVGTHYKNSTIKLSVGQTRTVSVNVLGEVVTPGTYTLSAFSTVFNALYLAGGITDIGTLRNIKVVRNGRTISTVDVYDFIMNGKLTGNVTLNDNDAIIVGAYDALVSIDGAIKRPMLYEMKRGESLKSLLTYAGGFVGDANKAVVRVERKTSEGYTVHSVDEWDYTAFGMEDGDSVMIDNIVKRYKNMVEVSGAVFYPGHYSLTGECNSVKGLVKKAGGLTETAFDNRAVLYRMNADRTRKVMSIDLKNILDGNSPDVVLENEDSLAIASDLAQETVKKYYIFGPLAKEGEFNYADSLTLEDAIVAAGGLKEEAILKSIEISRRIQYTGQRDNASNKKSELYTFDVENGLIVGNGEKFLIKPFDVITVKRNPDYTQASIVRIQGEVMYPGVYSLNSKTDRISEIIKRAGGLTGEGFAEGATLTRLMSEEERIRAQQLWEIAHERDTLNNDKIIIKDRYQVGVNLVKALQNPGSEDDIIVRGEDCIVIPPKNNVVKINGEVLYPNTVAYKHGKSASYYINQAGGITSKGDKKHSYILYANGQVNELKKGKILPGCEIVIQSKPAKVDNTQRTSLYLAAASTVATIAAVLMTALK